MRTKLYAILIALFILSSCEVKQSSIKNDSIKSELIAIEVLANNYCMGISTPDNVKEKIFNHNINDTINVVYKLSGYTANENCDLRLKTDEIILSKTKENPSVDKEFFEICIQSKDSISLLGLGFYDFDISGTFKLFIYHKVKKSLTDGNEIDVTVYLGINSLQVKDNTDWDIYLTSLQDIINTYKRFYQQLSYYYYKKNFILLSCDEKMSIYKLLPIQIMVDLEMEFCSSVPNNASNELEE